MKNASEILRIPNWINGEETNPAENRWLDKFNPDTGSLLSYFANSNINDIEHAVAAAGQSLNNWMYTPPVKRGEILFDLVSVMKEHASELANCIALETGKPPEDANGEVMAAILQAEFFAGEGMRLYGRTLTSALAGKQSFTVRQARGVAGLIVPANTPIANIAWKTFPALICGNTVVLKAAEDSPRIAHFFAVLTKKAGLPDGIFNVIQGSGQIAGAELVKNEKVAVISFTGSTEVGRWIGEVAGKRLTPVSLELGGKNPFVVCDDANLEQAVHWATLSAFSNAGQRCAAGSRILIFESVYKEFKKQFIAKAQSLKLGVDYGCNLGPVINKRQQENILIAINKARVDGGSILCGGLPPSDFHLANGYYVLPTIIEGLSHLSEVGCKELFGPVAFLHPVADIETALQVANSSEYGLTSAIHTTNVDRAMWFAQRVKAGVANVNVGTFGSEPHMPFGGFGASGNGTREPGVEALDIYSELKNISFFTRNELI